MHYLEITVGTSKGLLSTGTGTGKWYREGYLFGPKSNLFYVPIFVPVLSVKIQIGSIFRTFVDPVLYSEYGSGSREVNIE